MKALIFDFDGTIVDTEHAEILAWQAALAEHDLSLPDERWQREIGLDSRKFDPIAILENETGKKLDRKLILNRRRQAIAQLHGLLYPQPGILEWLEAARAMGLQLAIASNSSRNWIDKILEQLNLLHYFDLIVSRDDVKALKPDPEIYQLVLKKLNLTKDDVFVVEDSPAGTTAAIAAGLHCIVVPTKLAKNLLYPTTFCRVNTLEEITLQIAIEKFTSLLNNHNISQL